MYKRSIRYRNMAALLLFIMLCLVGYKGYFSWLKTDLYAKAAAFQTANNEIEAEADYTKAQQIRVIDYKEPETAEALAALQPAAELKRFFTTLSSDMKAAGEANDITLMLKTYNSYEVKAKEYEAKDEAAKKRFTDLSASNQTNERFTEIFTNAKQQLTKGLETDISSKTFKNDSYIVNLLQLPAVYYKDEKNKKQELNKLLERYDQARLEASFKAKSTEEVLKEISAIRKFYDANGVEAPWLQPKLEIYAQGVLAKQEKNDLKGFIASALLFQSTKELGGASSKVNTYIQTTIRKQFDRAEQLASTQKFADAIALYTVLDSYKDTKKEVSDTEQRWVESDPLQLLRKAVGSEFAFTNVVSAKGQWGSKLAAAGLVDSKLVSALMLQDSKINTAQTALDKGITVKSIQWSDRLGPSGKSDVPVLLLEAASKSRKARYIAYEIKTTEMRKILDVEADKMDYDRTGMLIFDNSLSDGPAPKAYYEYKDSRYAVTKTNTGSNTDVPLIPIAELTNHINEKIRFQGTITSVDNGKAIIQLSNGYILLSGSLKFKQGPAVITGMYIGSNEVRKANSTIYEYKVTVTDLTQ
jgi:hypothetical protein